MTLDRDDIDAVARRVVELIEDEVPPPGAARRLVDAATAARLLGVSRATVYAKADELGAVRIGEGKRARLRFDPARLCRLREPLSGRDSPAVNRRSRRRKSTERASGQLLPIRGGRNGTARHLGS